MKRREFITLLGGAAAAWPLVARAQQAMLPTIGLLSTGTLSSRMWLVDAFHRGLAETGHVEGRNVTTEYRWSDDDDARLPELAADLAHRPVAVIATLGGTAPPLAAKGATRTIPIVFGMGGDPVKLGLVASLNRPGGNVTGVNYMSAALGTKRLGLMLELLPRAERLALLVGPDAAIMAAEIAELRAVATGLGRSIEIVSASDAREIDVGFATLVERRTEALLVSTDALFTSRRSQVTALAARTKIPAIYAFGEFARAGGLASYGASLDDQARQTGVYVGRILKGEKPADLPVMRATRFELLINLQAARNLGISVPPKLLALADEIIE
jgi:putative tryptophan/tyrosine transport system substrate-binding protein